ncbi:DUF3592 domain-containing protein [Streptomyces sp. NPDC048182]|uniref:DUF3592 domain-containing protein n=1 Tax=Streptomyces sp. NPDC048182 TaxID=3365507 RepID=UPI003723E7D6
MPEAGGLPNDQGGLMEALFYVVPLVMIVGVCLLAGRTVVRTRQISGAWRDGRRAEGRCLRAYTSRSGDSSTQHHVYEFTTAEGRTVRFDEPHGRTTVVAGDHVTVYYLPDRPERATAQPPARAKLAAGSGCVLAFCAVFAAGCVGFMVVAHMMFAETEGLLP